MTAREKLKLDHPEWTDEKIRERIRKDCPSNYGYLKDPNCENTDCRACWDREIPEKKEERRYNMNATAQCEKCVSKEVCKYRRDLADVSVTINEALIKTTADGSTDVRVMDLSFIHPIEVKCKYYYVHTESAKHADAWTAWDSAATSTHTKVRG